MDCRRAPRPDRELRRGVRSGDRVLRRVRGRDLDRGAAQGARGAGSADEPLTRRAITPEPVGSTRPSWFANLDRALRNLTTVLTEIEEAPARRLTRERRLRAHLKDVSGEGLDDFFRRIDGVGVETL